MSIPCAGRLDRRASPSAYWRSTPAGLCVLVAAQCGGAPGEVEDGRNLVAGLAVMLGCAAEDLLRQDPVCNGPILPVVACATATKPGDHT